MTMAAEVVEASSISVERDGQNLLPYDSRLVYTYDKSVLNSG
jgi:hypothetical protein